MFRKHNSKGEIQLSTFDDEKWGFLSNNTEALINRTELKLAFWVSKKQAFKCHREFSVYVDDTDWGLNIELMYK